MKAEHNVADPVRKECQIPTGMSADGKQSTMPGWSAKDLSAPPGKHLADMSGERKKAYPIQEALSPCQLSNSS